MEHFRTLLTAQKGALSKDIDQLTKEIEEFEVIIDELKEKKNQANSQMRSIVKKLEKL
jgi:peptidoglycan hydrolase CwlO-like protein